MSRRFAVRGVVLDIEGTVSPLSYVHEVLFPFAAARVEEFLQRARRQSAVSAALRQLAADAGQADLADASVEEIAAAARGFMARDLKWPGLKALQGLIWEEGFTGGTLRAVLYPDVPPALAAWRERGLRLAIYSSGSVHAQQLFFGWTEQGDLRGNFAGWFDTTTGPKREAASYASIARALGLAPEELLFVSDVVAELDAARSAGWQTVQSLREGVVPGDPLQHPQIHSFAELEIELSAGGPGEAPAHVRRPTIALTPDRSAISILDQTLLPHRVEQRILGTLQDAVQAIRTMQVRGAPLIGVTAAYGLWLALREDAGDAALAAASTALLAARPTAVNLRWALDRMRAQLAPLPATERVEAALAEAEAIAAEDVAVNRAIGQHGLALLRTIAATKPPGVPVQVLTHCNAGRLGCVAWGTALAPLHLAAQEGLPIHVWVDETRPRNQGAALTTWELAEAGVPHTLIADNAGGHLMQRGEVDLCLVGADRVTRTGDTCNKIGTYLKALAAHDCGVPFYVAVPQSTIDFEIDDGLAGIPIEERDPAEVTEMAGPDASGQMHRIRLAPAGTVARNPAFDVTPARLVTAFVTEHGLRTAGELAGLRRVPAG